MTIYKVISLYNQEKQKRESENKYCLSVMNMSYCDEIWRASLFALGSFGYFCCQKYQAESETGLDSRLRGNDGNKYYFTNTLL